MITINQRGESNIIMNILRDNPFYCRPTGDTGCFYVFDVISMDSRRTISFAVEDGSPSQLSYQLFSISGSSTVNLNNAVVDLPKGEYWYTVYPASASTVSSVDRSIELALGKMKVQ